MGEVAAYFDLDGTLLDASSEKTLATELGKRRPWRIPVATVSWTLGFLSNILTGSAVYDAARNRGHFAFSNWETLNRIAKIIAPKLSKRIPEEARERVQWHRDQGHRLVLISATIKPLALALGAELGMDKVHGSGPDEMKGFISGSEKGWTVPRRKGKVPIIKADAEANGHDLSQCWAYGNTHADSFFMKECGNPVAINAKGALKAIAEEHSWEMHNWRI
jgi:HAD superfamily phosphoserine phosphatase-like hydrolase